MAFAAEEVGIIPKTQDGVISIQESLPGICKHRLGVLAVVACVLVQHPTHLAVTVLHGVVNRKLPAQTYRFFMPHQGR